MTFNCIFRQGLPGKCLYKSVKNCRDVAGVTSRQFSTLLQGQFPGSPWRKMMAPVISIRTYGLWGPFVQRYVFSGKSWFLVNINWVKIANNLPSFVRPVGRAYCKGRNRSRGHKFHPMPKSPAPCAGIAIQSCAQDLARGPKGVLAGPRTPRDPKSHLFVTNRVAVRVLDAGPPPNFIEFWRASFFDGSHQTHPGSRILDPGSWILGSRIQER